MATKYNLINCRYYITKTRWLSFTYNVPGYGQLKSVLSNYVCLWYRTPKLVRHGLHELFWLKRDCWQFVKFSRTIPLAEKRKWR